MPLKLHGKEKAAMAQMGIGNVMTVNTFSMYVKLQLFANEMKKKDSPNIFCTLSKNALSQTTLMPA